MSPDLALALAFADAADAISLGRFRASRPAGRDEARPDTGHRGRSGRRGGAPRAARARASGRRDARRGVRRHRRWQPPLDRRSDRRHPELLPRHPGLGDADRARGGRCDRARRRLGACPRAPLVGGARSGRVRERRSRSTSPASPGSRTPCSASRSSSRCRRSHSVAGTPVPTATSGRTCSSPRAPSTAPIDAVGVKIWDLAALQPIVEEAGGRFTRSGGRCASRRTLRRVLERAAPRGAARGLNDCATVTRRRRHARRPRTPGRGRTGRARRRAARSRSAARPATRRAHRRPRSPSPRWRRAGSA